MKLTILLKAAVVSTNQNAQAILGAGAPTGRFVVAATVTRLPNDAEELVPVITEAIRLLGQAPAMTVADAGYHSGEALAAAECAGYSVVMPESSTIDAPYHRAAFVHDTDNDTLTCPEGKVLTFRRLTKEKDQPVKRLYQGEQAVCRACPAFGTCTKSEAHGRTVRLSPHDALLQGHRVFRELPENKAAIKRRRELVEGVFGIVKEVLQGRRVLLRGKTNVEAEWSLLATAQNLRTLHRVWRNLAPAAQMQVLACGG